MSFIESNVENISLTALFVEAVALVVIAGAMVSIAISLKSKRKEK